METKETECPTCREISEMVGPEPLYRVVSMLMLWAMVASMIAYDRFIEPVETWTLVLIGGIGFAAIVLLIRWFICNFIGFYLVCWRDYSDGGIRVHFKKGERAGDVYVISHLPHKTALRLRVGGYFRKSRVLSPSSSMNQEWIIKCWDGRKRVTIIDRRGITLTGTPQEILPVVEQFFTVWGIYSALKAERAARFRLGAAITWLVNEAFLDRQRSQRSLAAMRLRREMMRILRDQFLPQDLQELQKEVGVDKDLVAKWGDEIRVLESKVGEDVSESSASGPMPYKL